MVAVSSVKFHYSGQVMGITVEDAPNIAAKLASTAAGGGGTVDVFSDKGKKIVVYVSPAIPWAMEYPSTEERPKRSGGVF